MLVAKRALPGYRLAFEFRDVSWVSSKNVERTLDFLSENDLTYVCVDEPQIGRAVPPVISVTTPGLAMVRLRGRNVEAWKKRAESAVERHRYFYSEAELREWVARIEQLTDRAAETHVLFANCYRDYAVRNASQLMRLLAQERLPVKGIRAVDHDNRVPLLGWNNLHKGATRPRARF
jgi:uncharacterized protein YecE (DUF72 family)